MKLPTTTLSPNLELNMLLTPFLYPDPYPLLKKLPTPTSQMMYHSQLQLQKAVTTPSSPLALPLFTKLFHIYQQLQNPLAMMIAAPLLSLLSHNVKEVTLPLT